MKLTTITDNPETGINMVCLIISAIAPSLAIGPAVGLPTGFAIALGLIAVIKAQRSTSGLVRRQYFIGAWFIRIFAGCFEQMAYSDQFTQRPTLPFELSSTTWAWLATIFMAAIDLWAYQATAARSQAKAEQQDTAESYARVERIQLEKERAETERRKLEMTEKLELAKIQADAEKEARKIEAETQAEARKIEAEASRKQTEIEAETKRKQAEERRKQTEIRAETTRKQAEDNRKQAEDNRKREEANRKEAEERRKQAEAVKAQQERIKQEKEQAERMQQEADRMKAEAEAEIKNRWKEAQPEDRKLLILEAEATLSTKLNRKPTQAEIAEELGTTDRTIRTYSKAA